MEAINHHILEGGTRFQNWVHLSSAFDSANGRFLSPRQKTQWGRWCQSDGLHGNFTYFVFATVVTLLSCHSKNWRHTFLDFLRLHNCPSDWSVWLQTIWGKKKKIHYINYTVSGGSLRGLVAMVTPHLATLCFLFPVSLSLWALTLQRAVRSRPSVPRANDLALMCQY